MDAVMSEAADTRLLSEGYTREEVVELLQSVGSILKADLGRELEHAAHMNFLVLQQVFQQVERIGLHFTIDTSQLEDAELLKEMRNFELAQREVDQKISFEGPKFNAVLTKDPTHHVELLRRNNNLEDQVQQWRSKYESLKEQALSTAQQCSALGSERTGMLAQLDTVSHQRSSPTGAVEGGGHSAVLALEQQLDAAHAASREAREELEIVKKSVSEKIDQSMQFQQLRKLISTKNAQLKEARTRLAKYEQADAGVECVDD